VTLTPKSLIYKDFRVTWSNHEVPRHTTVSSPVNAQLMPKIRLGCVETRAGFGRFEDDVKSIASLAVVNVGQLRSLDTASKHWASDQRPWSGRRESISRSQLGKLTRVSTKY